MRIVITLVLVSLSIIVQSQDRKARKILNKLSDEYTSTSGISINFDMTVKFPEEEPTIYPTTVLQSGNKFVFRNGEQEYFGNGENIWVYIPSQNEVQINDFEEDEAEDYFITPLDLMSQYKNDQYEYRISEERERELDIEFKPKDEFNDYSKFRITILTKSNEIKKIIAIGKDGSVVTILITGVKKNIDFDDKIFEFDLAKYPGVRVEDLRLN